LLLEGPAGSGKTQLALSVAAAANTHVERLQCYRGVTEDKAIGRFDEGLQRLYMEFSKGQHENWQNVQANLKGRDFFRPGPLMRALECDHSSKWMVCGSQRLIEPNPNWCSGFFFPACRDS
jgi:MoxR-like ATPase